MAATTRAASGVRPERWRRVGRLKKVGWMVYLYLYRCSEVVGSEDLGWKNGQQLQKTEAGAMRAKERMKQGASGEIRRERLIECTQANVFQSAR